MMSNSQEPSGVSLHLCLLSALAIAQPLYSLIGQNPEFLVAHNLNGLAVIGLVLLLSVVLPVLLTVVYRIVRAINRRIGTLVLFLMLWALITTVFLPVAVRNLHLDGAVAALAAVGVGLLLAVLYFRISVVRLFLSTFSFAAVVFPLLFLLYSPAREVLAGTAQKQGSAALEVHADNPVFILIFDEFPTLSILDSDMHIDRGRFPVLASLAQDAVWYRNHSANSNSTLIAIPALLSGNMPYVPQRGLPTAKNFPDNIFALLGKKYTVHAAEHATRLCPDTVCGKQPNEIRLLLSDCWILLENIIVPPAWATGLPRVNNDWKNFANLLHREPVPDTVRGFQKTLKWGTRVREYNDFINTITAAPDQLYYFHAMLPHGAWVYAPDGSLMVANEPHGTLAARPNSAGLPFKQMWYDDVAAMRTNRQRHVLQVGFVDTLVGHLVARLKRLGIYDNSLIVLTSDHGVSFKPGSTRRNVYKGNLVEISAVPLLIKYPGNKPSGIADVNSQSMDIIPTVLDVLGATGWSGYTGISLRNSAAQRPRIKVLHQAGKSAVTTDADKHLAELGQAAIAITAEYGEHDFASLFRAGDGWGLTGKKVSSLVRLGGRGPLVKFDQADLFQQVSHAGGFLPLVVHGYVQTDDTALATRKIALSVNNTIQAVSSLLQLPGMSNEFEMMLPPGGFTEGRNQVRAWLVFADENGVALQATRSVASVHYALTSDPGERAVFSVNGERLTVENRVVRGGVKALPGESDKLLLLYGWAADVNNGRAAKTVVVFINNQFYTSLIPVRASHSVAQRFKEPGLANCGFRIPITESAGRTAQSMEIRVFAISADQRVSELKHTDIPDQWPFKVNSGL